MYLIIIDHIYLYHHLILSKYLSSANHASEQKKKKKKDERGKERKGWIPFRYYQRSIQLQRIRLLHHVSRQAALAKDWLAKKQQEFDKKKISLPDCLPARLVYRGKHEHCAVAAAAAAAATIRWKSICCNETKMIWREKRKMR